MPNKKKIVAILSDLMFIAKIQEATKRVGLEAVFVKTEQDALEKATPRRTLPSMAAIKACVR